MVYEEKHTYLLEYFNIGGDLIYPEVEIYLMSNNKLLWSIYKSSNTKGNTFDEIKESNEYKLLVNLLYKFIKERE